MPDTQDTSLNERIDAELESLRKQHGVIRPGDVVEYAADPGTALHSQFTWDDKVAGHQYRLWQARQIISVRVQIIEKANEPVRLYVSLPSDRKAGNGYRALVDVLNDEEQRAELLATAMAELVRVRRKYAAIKQLAPVYRAIDKAQQQFEYDNAAKVAAG